MEVRRGESVMIKPSVGGDHLKSCKVVELSNLDLAAYTMYTKVLYAFHHPTPSTEALKEGLAKVLSLPHYRVLAGRYSRETPNCCLGIDLNDHGVVWIEGKADGSVADAMPFRPSSFLLHLVPPTPPGVKELFLVQVALGGSRSCELFNRNGELRNVRPCFRPLRSVLRWQYNFTEQEANEFADFLVPLLNFIPEDRPTAAQWLQHPWLNGVSSQKSNSHVDRARTVQQVSTKPQHKTGNRMTTGKDIRKAENSVSKDGGDKIILLPWKENI